MVRYVRSKYNDFEHNWLKKWKEHKFEKISWFSKNRYFQTMHFAVWQDCVEVTFGNLLRAKISMLIALPDKKIYGGDAGEKCNINRLE